MPELPEVETVVRDLRPLLAGRNIQQVIAGKQKLRRPWMPAWSQSIVGGTIQAIRRRGKWIVFDLSNAFPAPHDRPALLLHLGMTGQLTVAETKTPKQDHTHLIFSLDNATELRFRDVRRFGSADWFASILALDEYLNEKLGPEPFLMTANEFTQSIRASSRNLKALLLDQALIAGVGNIYADEACFLSRLHPGRLGKSLKEADCRRLLEAIVAVLTRAIEGRGSTIKDYIGGSGLMGTYQGEFRAYGRTGEPCLNCKAPIEMERLAGRSSHFCPKCQR